jgi:hypothetical protein
MGKKSIKFFLFFILLGCFHASFSQIQKNISVGDYIYVKPCKPKQVDFNGIDIYSRTIAIDKSKVDTITGDGFYEAFFDGKSSVEGKRLPCIMSNRKYKIAALQELEDEGKVRRIAICYTSYYLNVIWIEIDVALKSNEIEFK